MADVLGKVRPRAAKRRLMTSTALAALVLGAMGAGPAMAQDVTWDPQNPNNANIVPDDGDWDTATANWNTTPPANGAATTYTDGVVVTFDGTNGTPGPGDEATVTLTQDVSPDSILFTGNTTTFTIDASAPGNQLVSGAGDLMEITMQGLSEAAISAGLVGDFAVGGNGTLTLSGDTSAVDSLIVTVNAEAILSGVAINITGDYLVRGELSEATLQSGGQLELDSGDVTGNVDIVAGGEFESGGTSTVGGTLTSAGLAQVTSGELTVTGLVSNTNALLEVQDGATLDANGGVSVTGGVLIVGGAVEGTVGVTGTGAMLMQDGEVTGQVNVANVLDVTGTTSTVTGDIDSSGTVTVNSGTLEVTGTLTTTAGTVDIISGAEIAGDIDVDGGTLNLTNSTVTGDVEVITGSVAAAGPLPTSVSTIDGDLDTAATVTVSTGTLEVTGTTTTTGGTLTVASGAELDSNVAVIGGDLALNNGTVTGTVALGGGGDMATTGANATVAGTLASAGDVDIVSGELTVTGTVTTTGGTFDVADTTVLDATAVDVNGGTMTVLGEVQGTISADSGGEIVLDEGVLTGAVTVEDNGTLSVTSAAVAPVSTITGTLVSDGTTNVTDGTLAVTGAVSNTGGTLTVAGTLDAQSGVTVTGGNVAVTGDLQSAQTTVNGGALTLGGGGTVTGAVETNGTGAINSVGNGTITQTLTAGGGGTIAGGTLTVNELVTVDGGALTVAGSGTLDATMDVEITGGTLDVAGTLDSALTTASGGTLELSEGNVTGDVVVGPGGGLDSDGGSNIAGTLDFAGTGAVTGGVLTVTGVATQTGGTLTVEGGGTLALTSGMAVDGGTLAVEGTVGGPVTAETGGTIALNGGEMTGTVDIGPAGVLTSAGVSELSGAFVTEGDVDVTGGTLTTLGTATVNDGTLTVADGATLAAQGAGGLNIDGGTVTVAGTVEGLVTAETTGALTVDGGTVDGNVQMAAGSGALTLDGGTVDGNVQIAAGSGGLVSNGPSEVTGTLTNNGQAQVATGTLTATGPVVNQGTGTLTVSNGATLNTAAGVDVNSGSMALNGTVIGDVDVASTLTLANSGRLNGVLTTAPGGVANAAGGQIEVVDNQGTFNLTNSNTVIVTGSFDNSGTLDAVNDQAATLEVANTFASTGAIDGGATGLTISAGLIDLNAGTTLTGTVALLGDIENAIALSFGSDFTLAGSITNEATGTLSFDAVTTTAGFAIVNEAGGTLDVTGTLAATGSAITNQGTMTVSGTVDDAASLTNQGGAAQLTVSGTVANDVTNGGAASVTVTAAGEIDGTLDNTGTATVAGAVETLENSATGTLTLTGTATLGSLTNDGTADVVAGAVVSVGDEARNQGAGTRPVATGGILAADVINTGTAVLDIDGSVDGTVTNAATLALAGTVEGQLRNQAAGTLLVDGDATLGASLINGGQATVQSGQTLAVTGPVTNQAGAALTVQSGATLDGRVTNETGAALTLTGGTVEGTLTNEAGATVASTQASAITGDVATRGLIDVNGGTLTVGGDLTAQGQGTIDVAGGATLRVDGLLTNTGNSTLALTGTLLGDVSNGSGAFVEMDGGTFGSLSDPSSVRNLGTFSLDGEVFGSLSNLSSGVMTVDGVSSVSGAMLNQNELRALNDFSHGGLTNEGLFVLSPGVTVSGGTVDNTGRIVASGDVTVAGGYTGAGTIDMQNGTPGDSFAIVGAANLDGTRIEIDADLDPATAVVDTVSISGGPVSGQVDLQFDLAGIPLAELDAPLEVLSYDPGQANDLSFSQGGLPLLGSILFVLDDTGTGSVNVDSIQNPALGGLAGAVTLTQSLIGSVVNRPSSPFVAGLAVADSAPCGAGAWGRFTGGPADATGTTQASTSSGSVYSFGSEISADYAGIQLGGDFSCFDGFFNGWDLSFGGIGGINTGSTAQPVFLVDATTGTVFDDAPISNNFTDFTQTYAGAYVSAFRDNLLLDLQYRLERTSFDLSNDGVGVNRLGILDQTFDSRAQTLSGSASYAFPLSEELGVTLVPTLGFAITATETDRIAFEDGAFLQIDDSVSQVGFIGASVSRSIFLPDNVSALTYFATGTVYNDFADDVRSVYFDGPGAEGEESFSSNLGTYGELSVGANYTRVLDLGGPVAPRQFNASVRLDTRFGDSLDSWGLTGQVRYQF